MRKPKSSSKRPPSSSSSRSQSFLSQLESLREFVSGCCSPGMQFSESDLSTCLRQCGYNVQLAAERLVTGQYKCTPTSKKRNSDYFNATKSLFVGEKAQTDGSKRKKMTSVTSVIDIESDEDDGDDGDDGDDDGDDDHHTHNDMKLKNKSMQKVQKIQKQKVVLGQSPVCTGAPVHRVTPQPTAAAAAVAVGPLRKSNTNNSTSRGMLSNDKSINEHSNVSLSSSPRLLLCRRWIVGFSTTRRGTIKYHEQVNISSTSSSSASSSNNNNANSSFSSYTSSFSNSKKKVNILRFKGQKIEGTFDTNLSQILVPLLSYHKQQPKHNNKETVTSPLITPLIQLETRALMEDRNLTIGTEIPLELKVYICKPIHFFRLFNHQQQHHQQQQHLHKLKKQGGSPMIMSIDNVIPNLTLFTNAAFNLLQWAYYGDVPSFEQATPSSSSTTSTTTTTSSSSSSSTLKNDEQSIEQNKKTKGTDHVDIYDNQVEGIEEDEDDSKNIDEAIEAKKETFELQQEQTPVWAQDIFSTSSSTKTTISSSSSSTTTTTATAITTENTAILTEEVDPKDFHTKGIQLHTYQREALHWMISRENQSNTKESQDLQKHLELLSDLAMSELSNHNTAGNHRKGHDYIPSSDGKSGDDGEQVQCEVGPILVTKEMASRVTTLKGVKDPVCHPLWKKRYLWNKNDNGSGGGGDSDIMTSTSSSTPSSKNHCGVYSFFVNEVLQTASINTPDPPRECCGGILADTMGLGKTIMLLALICKDKEYDCEQGYSESSFKLAMANQDHDTYLKRGEDVVLQSEDVQNVDKSIYNRKEAAKGNTKDKKKPKCTLVVTPLSLLTQWEEEISSKTSLSYETCYGDSCRKAYNRDSDLNHVDVLLTTYGTLQSEYRRTEKRFTSLSNLLSLNFKRVILDESHLIKNPDTTVSKACCSIKAERRWCVTGTPITNSLNDVYGLIKFLKHEPWCDASFWKRAITRVMNKDDGHDNQKRENLEVEQPEGIQIALGRVKRVLNPLLLRRTKDTVGKNGKPILVLPPIEHELIKVEFTNEERHFYNALLDKSQTVFDGFMKQGTVSKSWFAIFSLLQRLRQACDHLSLTVKAHVNLDDYKCQSDDDQETSIHDKENQLKGSTQGTPIPPQDKFLKELLDTFTQHQSSGNQNLPLEQQMAAKSHSEKVALSLSQYMQCESSDVLTEECSICLDIPQANDIAITPCSHVFCHKCLIDALKMNDKRKDSQITTSNVNATSDYGTCPNCMAQISVAQIKTTGKQTATVCAEKMIEPSSNQGKNNDFNARETLEAAVRGNRSSKVTAILNELDNIWTMDPKSKILIYSQYLGMFDLLGIELEKQGISYFRLDGKMSLKQRSSTLIEFNSSSINNNGKTNKASSDCHSADRGTVLLASMKACGVGLNLVSASSVFIVDPWWNAAIEDQCINRIHRIGQQANIVRVRKFVVSDSVEEKIVKLQEQKKGMAGQVLSDQNDQMSSSSLRPTIDDFKAIFGR